MATEGDTWSGMAPRSRKVNPPDDMTWGANSTGAQVQMRTKP